MISLIVAKGINGEIGAENRLLWRLPSDLQHFQNTTMGSIVVMGRKTWESIGSKPLRGRFNIVISSTPWKYDGIVISYTAEEYLRTLLRIGHKDNFFIIGGAEIYREFASLVDVMYITEVEQEFPEADTFFPETPFLHKNLFREEVLSIGEENGLKYTIKKYERM